MSFHADGDKREMLLFRLDREEYGVDIQNIQEIRMYDGATHIANAPDHLKGVINLRGKIVPIIDLRIKFGRVDATCDRTTVVVVMELGEKTIGFTVDGVSDVVVLESKDIKPPPSLSLDESTNYMLGLASFNDRLVILVDMEKLLLIDELYEIATVGTH